jgi:hypothetical protein
VRRLSLDAATTSCSSRSCVSSGTALAVSFHEEAHTGMVERGELAVMALAGVLIRFDGIGGDYGD